MAKSLSDKLKNLSPGALARVSRSAAKAPGSRVNNAATTEAKRRKKKINGSN